jgi:hypothetical protein
MQVELEPTVTGEGEQPTVMLALAGVTVSVKFADMGAFFASPP